MDESDKLRRAYVRLQALRANLGGGDVASRYVDEYHGALDHLAELGYDVDEFRIPAAVMKHPVISISMRRGGGVQYGKGLEADSTLFRIKLDSVLSYFGFGEEQLPRPIGFEGPRKP